MNTVITRLSAARYSAIAALSFAVAWLMLGPAPRAAAAIDDCEGVEISKDLAKPILTNAENLFKEYGGWIAFISIVIGVVLSKNGKGASWFKYAFFLIALLAIYATLKSSLTGMGGSPC